MTYVNDKPTRVLIGWQSFGGGRGSGTNTSTEDFLIESTGGITATGAAAAVPARFKVGRSVHV